MQYLLDTVTVVRHFSDGGQIGRAAAQILDLAAERDDLLVVSVVSLMEIMYLAERNRIPVSLDDALQAIDATPSYVAVNLTPEIIRVAEAIAFPELHDRLILATAKWLDVAIISSDRGFLHVPGLEVIWD